MVPLRPTGKAGEMIAGVRFRARQLSAALHPTIPVHSPLVFDIVDRWKERSVARCIYYATTPADRMYTTRPLNAAEAEERRRGRFEEMSAPAETMAVKEEETNPVFPTTLDLRFPAPVTRGERPGVVP
jgi:uncharacterized protein (DUF2126 family)